MPETVSKKQLEYMKKLKLRKSAIRFFQLLLLFGFFMLWELLALYEVIDPFIFSSPSRMLSSLWAMTLDGSIFLHIGITLFETLTGFALGTVLGMLIAILLWWSDFISDVSEPYLVVLNSLPKTALAPIIIVWMGNNMKAVILTALLTSVVVTILSILSGFQSIDKDQIKLIYTFGGTKKQALFKVVLPASVPAFVSALKISIGLSFVGVIVGEFLVAKYGLGYLIVYGSQVFKLDWVMLSVILLAVFAALLYYAVAFAEKKVSKKWK